MSLQRPQFLAPHLDGIPAELRERPQWVVWRLEWTEERGTWTKVPYQARNPQRRASSTKPDTWARFEDAWAALEQADGVGYVFSADDPYVGLDLDDLPEADKAAIMSALDSYAERSVTKVDGYHVLARAQLNGSGRHPPAFGVFDQGRFFVVTGAHVVGTPTTIEERQAQLDVVLAHYLPPEPEPVATPSQRSNALDVAEAELIRRAQLARNGGKFSALFAGDSGGYASQSEADLALCSLLAFWTGRDDARMDSLFRGSGLMRPKWDEPRGEGTYGSETITLAIEGCREIWRPGRPIPPGVAVAASEDEPATRLGGLPLTDLGNAERLARRHGRDLRYCPARGWLVWDGHRWRRDEAGEVTQRMAETIRTSYFEALTDEDDDARKALIKHAFASEREARIRAAITLAATVPELVVRPNELDADPDLLNVGNGTLHLPSAELCPHDRADLLTMLTPVDYDPDAEAPTWVHFLERVTAGRAELANFLQKAAGYTLAGRPREHVALILYGKGANGKTTLLEALRELFEDYGQQTPASTFLDRREGIPSDVARLNGARFVSAVEMPDGRRLNETLVKRLTGGDMIAARFLHREWFEFRPIFVPWIATNHKPTVRGTDEAIWRRIRLVPFDVQIPEAERDRDLPDKLRSELPGILRWAVEGHAAYLRQGLEPPVEVLAATENYRQEQDLIGRFLEECCELGADLRAKPSDLYRAFTDYVGREEKVGTRSFYAELQRRGFEASRTGRARWYLGLALAAGGLVTHE